MQVTNEPSKYEATLIITGAGGFGKTTTVISLCYYPAVKKEFTDGFIFIELGPQATDSSVKLRAIYNLLTNEQCEINVVEQKLNQLTSDYYRNLLVIIDDVWHVEDALPIVKAFTNCKIILTTRMNDIEQYIPSKQSVITIGPMTQTEAISLLTYGVIDSSQLSQEDMSLLSELAHDIHLWPLLLSLIRGQLSHNLKQYRLSQHKAIKNVQAKLHHKGLTAFDKNIIETINKSRSLAVKACIEVTLELLTKSISDKIKTLIVWTGIGTSFQTAVLSNLWNVGEQEAENTVNTLWAYGLVQFTSIMISSNNNTQHYVEVHAVISQYIIETMDSHEVIDLSPCIGLKSKALCGGLVLKFQESYGIHEGLSITSMDYLKYKLSELENIWFPFYLKLINMFTVTDPHVVLVLLHDITDILMASSSPYSLKLLALLEKDINLLTVDCKQTLNDAHKFCRVFNQNVQRILQGKDYDKLIQTVEEYINNYPLCNIAQKAITIVKKMIPNCDGQLLHSLIIKCELLHIATADYHEVTTLVLPTIKLYINLHKQITSSLLNGSPYVEMTYDYIISGKFNEEEQLKVINRNIKLLEVAPHVVSQEISE